MNPSLFFTELAPNLFKQEMIGNYLFSFSFQFTPIDIFSLNSINMRLITKAFYCFIKIFLFDCFNPYLVIYHFSIVCRPLFYFLYSFN